MSSSDSDNDSFFSNLVKNIDKKRNVNLEDDHSLRTASLIDHDTTTDSKIVIDSETEQPAKISVSVIDISDEEPDILNDLNTNNKKNKKGVSTRNSVKRGRASKRAKKSTSASDDRNEIDTIDLDETVCNESVSARSRRKTKNSNSESNVTSTMTNSSKKPHNLNVIGSNQRGRGKSRGGRGSRKNQRARNATSRSFISSSIISIGNTDEYADLSDSVPLFKQNSQHNEDVKTISEADPLDDNEELDVKVIWQSVDIVKFNIRKFQKLKQIFDHFSKEKNVSVNNLIFTYNGKILSCDDTPDSIKYSIAKFIDGGIVTQNVKGLVVTKKAVINLDGIDIKFQCTNRTYVATIERDDKLLLAMTKCAEHLELPLSKLKFEFDGDCISGSSTPNEMDFEGGECIDVKILK